MIDTTIQTRIQQAAPKLDAAMWDVVSTARTLIAREDEARKNRLGRYYSDDDRRSDDAAITDWLDQLRSKLASLAEVETELTRAVSEAFRAGAIPPEER